MATTTTGIGSTLDVNSIVEQLVQVERRPILLLDQREARLQGRLSMLGVLKGALATLQLNSLPLAGAETVTNSARSSDSAAFGAAAASNAVAGSYTVDVTRLAQAQKLVAAGRASSSAAIGAGGATTITLTQGSITGGTFDAPSGTYSGATFTANAAKTPVTINIGASNNTLEGIRDAINAANAGVSASIVNDGSGTPYRLALSVADTGAASSLKIDVSGEAAIASLLGHDPGATQNLSQTQAAQDALITVDGVAVTRATNTVVDAIQGVTLTLLKTTTAPATLTVARSHGAVEALNGLVKSYNDLNSAIASATAKGAQLQGDAGVIHLQQRLRQTLGTSYGAGAYATLSSLGVTFQSNGSLKFDSTKLAVALEADAPGTLATIAGAGNALKSLSESALGTEGLIQAGTDRVNGSIETISERRIALERRLVDIERRYRAQFVALDTLLSSMNQTSQFLDKQLSALANLNGGK